tara:strand:+ start:1020 stop:1307 length:288 start_codon:yes stop_codon:yes gene_type:complete
MYVTSEIRGSDIVCQEYVLDENISPRWSSLQTEIHNLHDLDASVKAAHQYHNGCLVIPFKTNDNVADIKSGKHQLAYQVILGIDSARRLRSKENV